MDPKDTLSERREQLNRSLDERRRIDEEVERKKARTSDAQGFAQAMRLSTEFVAGVLVGGGLGWFADQFLGTSPWGLIVFLLLGFVAGVLNVLRSAGLMAEHKIRAADDDRAGPARDTADETRRDLD
ncbi:AtpZ/AtpI family protein [Breoghania sp. L-A4]|uniref:AtpZ/AtpI family protein n=1 Tax=Breoghania sp. L-A4 TaxID=2304600 RepID=UPI0019681A18|nr:AtpZ/AtpI family protein [Breoghania sp. L-A4]